MNHACPICERHIVKGLPLSWTIVFNGEPTEFRLDVCPVDHVLCQLFPTLKNAVMRSEVVGEMLRKIYR